MFPPTYQCSLFFKENQNIFLTIHISSKNIPTVSHKLSIKCFHLLNKLEICSHGQIVLAKPTLSFYTGTPKNSTKPNASTQVKALMCMVLCYTVCSIVVFPLKRPAHKLMEPQMNSHQIYVNCSVKKKYSNRYLELRHGSLQISTRSQ